MKNTYIKQFLVGSLSSLTLAACGGGGSGVVSGGSPAQNAGSAAPVTVAPAIPVSSISGVFDGTLDSGAPITILTQKDGSYFMVYSNSETPHQVAGAIVGTGTLASGSFSSNDALDLGMVASAAETPLAVTLSASYVPMQSFDVTLKHTLSGQVTTFATAYNNTYTVLPTLPALAGVYQAAMASSNASEVGITLTINKDGTLTGQLSCGCNITAALTPRADGLAYVANLSMAGGDNILSNKTLAGNVYFDAIRNRLYIVGNIVGTSEMVIFVGTKS